VMSRWQEFKQRRKTITLGMLEALIETTYSTRCNA
jgi:hypothetical protein